MEFNDFADQSFDFTKSVVRTNVQLTIIFIMFGAQRRGYLVSKSREIVRRSFGNRALTSGFRAKSDCGSRTETLDLRLDYKHNVFH